VQIKIKQKLITVTVKPKSINGKNSYLNQTEKTNKYQEHLQSLLQEIKEETDINQNWQNLKQVILEAATEFKSAKGVRNANHW
jgi:hypothetical protein